jgi:prepilin-type N-terminal cleavage/methylation domain-containing protein
MKDRKSGFTLIELLIVVVIIGILAAIAIPKFSAARQRAFRSAMMSDLRNLASLQEVYYNEQFTYTNSLVDLTAVSSDGVTLTIGVADATGWSATATHAGLVNGESCAVYHGDAPPVAPAAVESTIGCSF